jgi:hypothetical protein
VSVTTKAVEESSAVDGQREMLDQREPFGQDCSDERGEDVRTGEDERVVCVKKLDPLAITMILSMVW